VYIALANTITPTGTAARVEKEIQAPDINTSLSKVREGGVDIFIINNIPHSSTILGAITSRPWISNKDRVLYFV
jgi:hypothetical protein